MSDLVLGIDHVSVLVQDTRRSLDFYRSVLGLEVDPSRPDLGYPGAWLRARHIDPAAVTVGSKWGYTYTAGWQIAADKHEVKEHSLGHRYCRGIPHR